LEASVRGQTLSAVVEKKEIQAKMIKILEQMEFFIV
jgi:hypothetical protein